MMKLQHPTGRRRSGSCCNSIFPYTITPEDMPKPHVHFHQKAFQREIVRSSVKSVLSCEKDRPFEVLQNFVNNLWQLAIGMGRVNVMKILFPKLFSILV